jgi:nitrite reductase/ring-hydroxylating ferredoxin subunit
MNMPDFDSMYADEILICEASLLTNGGKGVRFPVTAGGEDASGFVVRYMGSVRGYLNRCAHVSIELDWNEGEFFESSGSYLMCSTHGAMYVPETGKCAGGPCRGGRLRPIIVSEHDNQVFWTPDEFVRPARA